MGTEKGSARSLDDRAYKETEELSAYIGMCTSPYHAVHVSEARLRAAGFESLPFDRIGKLRPGNYVMNVYGSTLIAVHIGETPRDSLRIMTGHTDFPALRVKPNPLMSDTGYYKLNVEAYGGLLLSTWTDRPLAMSGIVACRSDDPYRPKIVAVDSRRPIATIPNLAIHMNRNANEGTVLNRQKDMLPVLGTIPEGEHRIPDDVWRAFLLSLMPDDVCVLPEDILSYELTLYPAESGAVHAFGNAEEATFSSHRLDNMTSCLACLKGIEEAKRAEAEGIRIVVLFDNEEVGSRTKQGGASSVLPAMLRRIYDGLGLSEADLHEDIARGFMLSADAGHALHPNHPEKNDVTNVPRLNGGVLLKIAASQSYAGDAVSIAAVTDLCLRNDIPHQVYVNRSDIPGGSTLGPIVSSVVPMRTMDVGVPILAMHSARETGGVRDQSALNRLAEVFLG